MNDAREQILDAIRRSLKRGALDGEARQALEQRLAAHQCNLIPARAAALDHAGQVELFVTMAEAVQTTGARVAGGEDVPAPVADYLSQHNLPSPPVVTPDPRLDGIPWERRPPLELRRRPPEDA